MDGLSVGILGASGVVGNEILRAMEERNFPCSELRLFAAPEEEGNIVKFRGETYHLTVADEFNLEGLDLLFVAASAEISRKYSPMAVKNGAVVIDNSPAYRMAEGVPLIVPEVNPDDVKNHKGIIANPNCSTIIALLAVYPLYKKAKITRMIVSTYQAVSGAGILAMNELDKQVRAYAKGEELKIEAFQHQIAFNVIPHIDKFDDRGYTLEEMKLLTESRKILHDNDISVNCTCVRVPVFRSHSESIYIEFEEGFDVKEARELLAEAEGVKLLDDAVNNVYPMPLDSSNQDLVFVGRLRQDLDNKRAVSLWCCGDQLRKGAAVNAVQIAELMMDSR